MQPIHYSLIFNVLILLITGALAWQFTQPLIFVIGLLCVQHAYARFGDDDDDEPPQGGGGAPMGFV